MQYALMLYFDDKSSLNIKEYILKLNDVTNNKYMLDENMPAHITLAMWNSDNDYIDKIKTLADTTKRFDVNFASLGMFNDEERHIFLSPVKSAGIIELHKKVYETINLPDENDFISIYKNQDIWVPHVTIGYQVKQENLHEALEVCTDIKFPIKARAAKLAYAVCCPFNEVAILELEV